MRTAGRIGTKLANTRWTGAFIKGKNKCPGVTPGAFVLTLFVLGGSQISGHLYMLQAHLSPHNLFMRPECPSRRDLLFQR